MNIPFFSSSASPPPQALRFKIIGEMREMEMEMEMASALFTLRTHRDDERVRRAIALECTVRMSIPCLHPQGHSLHFPLYLLSPPCTSPTSLPSHPRSRSAALPPLPPSPHSPALLAGPPLTAHALQSQRTRRRATSHVQLFNRNIPLAAPTQLKDARVTRTQQALVKKPKKLVEPENRTSADVSIPSASCVHVGLTNVEGVCTQTG
ncbi:hypothetical protein C8R47DRAFT_641868 [Mycena vitilis]|nr:hypothetical protein C8R47DRAFT_641868 [Mycena vitilis]